MGILLRSVFFTFFLLTAFVCRSQMAEGLYHSSVLEEVPFNEVKVEDAFWLPKIRVVQEVTIPSLLNLAEEQGKIDNFRIVAGLKEGKISLYNAPDSDVYKLIEAAGYSLHSLKNQELENRVDNLIDLILKAQAPNGYLHTQYMLSKTDPSYPDTTITSNLRKIKTFGYGPENQWKSLSNNWPFAYSQLYCAGHFMEAAVAYYRGTGKRKFLDGAIKFADLICSVFSKKKVQAYADHPEVEIGLMKLYEVTGDKKYYEMANLFSRYVNFSRPPDISKENEKPLAQQRHAFGHGVRTAYIYSGATDVVRVDGADDLKVALDSLWYNIVGKKMYIHGGTGNGTKAEQHGWDNDLPIGATYSESCANIAQGQWNHRLNLLTGDAKFGNLVEHEAYNSALSGISLDGKNFFYSNKLNIDVENRKNEHSGVRSHYLFCCPSKLPGFVTGIGRWAYAKNESGLYVNLFFGSKVKTKIGGKILEITQRTMYPFDGEISFTFDRVTGDETSMYLRIPSWIQDRPIPFGPYLFDRSLHGGYSITLNGEIVTSTTLVNGYIKISRKWKPEDTLNVNFEMPPRLIRTEPQIVANRGRVALMRGPLLYSLEQYDNHFNVLELVIGPEKSIQVKRDPSIFGGIPILEGKGKVDRKEVDFRAIPYFLWQNRGVGRMATLLIENVDKIEKETKEVPKKFNTDGK